MGGLSCTHRVSRGGGGRGYVLRHIPYNGMSLERFRIVFTTNGKREIRVYVFLKKLVHRLEKCKIILTFHANAKLLNFTEKLKTASGKCRISMRTWSFLPFAVNVILNLSNCR